MQIKEVEERVGITRKNIRFYEDQGLLSPRRNRDNGYREYSPEDVALLERIKLLRKLGVPLEEIRQLQSGEPVAEAARKQIRLLEQEQHQREVCLAFCRRLTEADYSLDALDAPALLADMARLEREEGAQFMDKQKQDYKRFLPPIGAAVVMLILMIGCIALELWGFAADPAGAPPLPLTVFLIALPAVVAVGVSIALYQRLRELQHDEREEARKY